MIGRPERLADPIVVAVDETAAQLWGIGGLYLTSPQLALRRGALGAVRAGDVVRCEEIPDVDVTVRVGVPLVTPGRLLRDLMRRPLAEHLLGRVVADMEDLGLLTREQVLGVLAEEAEGYGAAVVAPEQLHDLLLEEAGLTETVSAGGAVQV